MKALMITIDIIAVSIFIGIIGMIYIDYWREKNRKRTPYDREQERLMRTYKPESWDEEFDEDKFHDWRKYITDERNSYLQN